MKLKVIGVGVFFILALIAYANIPFTKEEQHIKASDVEQHFTKEELKKPNDKEEKIFPEHTLETFSTDELDAELKEREDFEADSEVVEAESVEISDTKKAEESIETMRDDIALLKALENAAPKTPTPTATEDVDDRSVVDMEDESVDDGVVPVNNGNNVLSGGLTSKKDKSNHETTTINNEVNKPTPTPTATPEPRYAGQVRGYAMLYLMQPEARQTVEGELRTLIESRLKEVYLGVLTDGTFGKDFDYLSSVVKRIADADMQLTLALYLTNGSSMRRHSDETMKGGFNNISPEEFRSLIQYDSATRERFSLMVREVLPVFQLNQSLNPANKNIAIVMLEDNLDTNSYRAMRELAENVLGNLVLYVRNPCPGCYPGNNSESLGDRIELHHSTSLPNLGRGMGITLDGEGFYFPWEIGGGLSIEAVKSLEISAAAKQLAYVGLWRAKRQGINGDGYKPASLRYYEVPTEEQRELEIEVLRNGLEEVE